MLLLHAAISSPNTIALDADVIPRKTVPALHAYAPGRRDLSQSLLAQTSVGAVSAQWTQGSANCHESCDADGQRRALRLRKLKRRDSVSPSYRIQRDVRSDE